MGLAMPYNTLLTTAPLLTSQWKLLSNYRAYLDMSNMSGRVWRLVPSLWPKMLRYSIPAAAGSTPMILGERVDQLVIAGFLPAEELGLYAVAVSWSLLMQLPGAALFGVAFSKIAGMQRAQDQWSFIKKACWATIG